MPWGEVKLIPGVNTERTPTLNEAGVVASSFIRYKDSLIQKFGGWQAYYPFNVATIPRELHGWEDLRGNLQLGIGATSALQVLTNATTLTTITPQTLTSSFVPNVSTTINSPTVGITDPNIANVTTYDTVFFNVPVSQGGVILSGAYPIIEITGGSSYNITAEANATTTESNPTATNNTTAAGNNTLHFASTPGWVAAGMMAYDITTSGVIPTGTTVLSTTGSTVVLSNNVTGGGVGSGDNIVFSNVPIFTTTQNSAVVAVNLPNHGLTTTSVFIVQIAASGNGVTLLGNYDVLDVVDANNFQIAASAQASATSSFPMNSGNVQLIYYLTQGPALAGQGYGIGAYGAGAYGLGTTGGSSQTGTPITATDWTSDNWGEIYLACPSGGGVYSYDPTAGFSTAQLVSGAPIFNGGIFVSTQQQILVCWGAAVDQAIGTIQNPLAVAWSTIGDYTDFTPLATDTAGNFIIPTGSKIMAGAAVMNQDLIFTDIDLWAMNFVGGTDVFGFVKIGAGMGAISSHAVQQLRGNVYWMANNNFCSYTAAGPAVMPCPVWDAVFQNLNTSFVQNIRAMPNTPFNEVGWLFPSSASASGENDSYIKVNITEPGMPWDIGIGVLNRSAWIDLGALGMPIGAASAGQIYQHETTSNAAGAPLNYSFTTGYFMLAEGEDFVVVNQIVPDMKWGFYPGSGAATVHLTFSLVNFPGDSPTTFGPFAVTQTTQLITQQMRGRQMAVTLAGSDLNSFTRLGRIRYRYAPSGRR